MSIVASLGCQAEVRGFSLARYALDAPVFPLVADTLPLAEAVRTTLMGVYQRRLHVRKYGTGEKPYRERFLSATLSGKDAAGRPLVGHGHAFFLPADEDGDGRIDHVTVVAAAGFTADEVQALDRLRQVRMGDQGDQEPLRLMLVGLGKEEDFRSPLLAESVAWVSATPFVVTRYPKRRGQKRDLPADLATPQQFARRVLSQELDRLRQRRPELPAVVEVELLPDGVPVGQGSRRLRPIQFHRFRKKASDDGGRRPAGAFRIVFAAPVPGPLCLGHSSHFGLGLFLPEHRGQG